TREPELGEGDRCRSGTGSGEARGRRLPGSRADRDGGRTGDLTSPPRRAPPPAFPRPRGSPPSRSAGGPHPASTAPVPRLRAASHLPPGGPPPAPDRRTRPHEDPLLREGPARREHLRQAVRAGGHAGG